MTFYLRLLVALAVNAAIYASPSVVHVSEVATLHPAANAFATWATSANSSAAHYSRGIGLAFDRTAEMARLAGTGDYAALLSAVLSIGPEKRAALPKFVVLDDVLVSATASLTVSMCMPQPPITATSAMHIERYIKFTGNVYASGTAASLHAFHSVGTSALPLLWAAEAPRGMDTCHDSTPVVGAFFSKQSSVQRHIHGNSPFAVLPLPGTAWFLASPTVAGATLCINATAAAYPNAAMAGAVHVPHVHKCIVGGIGRNFTAPALASLHAVALHASGARQRLARLRLRPAHRFTAQDATTSRQHRNILKRGLSLSTNNTAGGRSILFLSVYFKDQNASAAVTVSDATVIANQSAVQLLRMSYGALHATVTVHPTVLKLDLAYADEPLTLAIMGAAMTAARISNDDYDHVVLVMNNLRWFQSWSGLGAISGNGVWLNHNPAFPQYSVDVVCHEIGTVAAPTSLCARTVDTLEVTHHNMPQH